ncbi:unnamed protein product [Didymodactylos carnosus]|uniref:Uncharacterized protein n=1 Tax=Didymodactylos carnosus TaxID=1234261 RepID=A0A814X1J5_9BILA|nr:unnamed protein product [Didymodactylos carnosus]CAF3974090.1 unnamed protein product [Didymodactylos carnosus]
MFISDHSHSLLQILAHGIMPLILHFDDTSVAVITSIEVEIARARRLYESIQSLKREHRITNVADADRLTFIIIASIALITELATGDDDTLEADFKNLFAQSIYK